jgi:DNA-binding transcriptional ArsR family regulator
MDAAVRALAQPRRREILTLVATRELSAGEIASHFDVTRPAISQHLGVLKAAGLVDERRQGTRRLYQARPQGLAELRSFLESFWESRLRRLKHIAESQERSSRSHAISRQQSRRARDKGQRRA